MLQAMNTGHEGSLTTIHANSPRDALSRIETLVLTAGVELPRAPSASRSRAPSTCSFRSSASWTARAGSRTSPRCSGWSRTSSRCRTSSSPSRPTRRRWLRRAHAPAHPARAGLSRTSSRRWPPNGVSAADVLPAESVLAEPSLELRRRVLGSRSRLAVACRASLPPARAPPRPSPRGRHESTSPRHPADGRRRRRVHSATTLTENGRP